MPFVNPEPATAVTKLTKKTLAFFLFTFHWVHLQENRKKHIKKYMCITYTFFIHVLCAFKFLCIINTV